MLGKTNSKNILILFWLTSKLFITHFKILEGYITKFELYCLLFYNQVQETQIEPTCLLKKKPHQNPNRKQTLQKNQPETSGLETCFSRIF